VGQPINKLLQACGNDARIFIDLGNNSYRQLSSDVINCQIKSQGQQRLAEPSRQKAHGPLLRTEDIWGSGCKISSAAFLKKRAGT
jgi:hypothetical protein